MAVLMEFAIFPLDKGASVSDEVSQVIKLIQNSGYNYQLTTMGTLVETETIEQAMAIVSQAANILQQDCDRIYSTLKLDIKKGSSNLLKSKVKSINDKLNN